VYSPTTAVSHGAVLQEAEDVRAVAGRGGEAVRVVGVVRRQARGVAAQAAFASKGLKPGYHFIGSRVEETRLFFELRGNYWIHQLAPPHRDDALRGLELAHDAGAQPVALVQHGHLRRRVRCYCFYTLFLNTQQTTNFGRTLLEAHSSNSRVLRC
jgi:hypothetical protein